MSKYQFSPSPQLTPIERQRCSHCTSRMMLSRISPGPIGFEHRLFECPKCDFVQNEVVASDTMKSASVGWLAIAHLQEKLEQARRLLQQVSDPTTTESLKALIADLESRLSDLLEPE